MTTGNLTADRQQNKTEEKRIAKMHCNGSTQRRIGRILVGPIGDQLQGIASCTTMIQANDEIHQAKEVQQLGKDH